MPSKIQDMERRVGKGFADRQNAVVLTIGEYQFTRRVVNKKLECGYTPAVSRLNKVVKRHYSSFKTVSAMARAVKCWDLESFKHVGDVTVYVFMCVMKYAKIDPDAWLDSDYTIATTCRNHKKKARKKHKK